jgi:hypothetical protein
MGKGEDPWGIGLRGCVICPAWLGADGWAHLRCPFGCGLGYRTWGCFRMDGWELLVMVAGFLCRP